MEINNNRKDWALEKLGDFADYEKGKKPKNQSPIQTEIFKYPYVNIQAFEKGIIDEYTDGEKCNFCSENDFLMVWDGSRFGLIGKGIKGAIGSTLMKINFPGIENHFAYYFLKSKYLEINSKPKGTGTPHVNPDLLWNYIFPIAPLPEQRAIVSKIEQLFSDLDNGIENFKKAQAQLKLYRKSVLKAACEGKLVPTEAELARAEGRDYEAADVLLARVLKERRSKYKESGARITRDLSAMPEGWCLATVEELNPANRTCAYGVLQPGDDVEIGVPLVRVGDIKEGRIVATGMKKIVPQIAEEYTRTKLEGGEVLITLVEMTSKSHEVARKTLNLEDVRATLIALPPLAEQRRIVAEVERRLSVSDKMEATITESLQKAESLRQSILKKAFKGKLLNKKELEKARNSPDWEPAEKLLERIHQEKQIKENNNKPARRKIHG